MLPADKLKMNKKAQGLSMNMIILAAIALIVLIVLVVIFYGKAKSFSASAEDCKQKGGDCQPKTQSCDGPNLGQMGCADDQFCCMKMGEEQEGGT
jgi:hypothetical protein